MSRLNPNWEWIKDPRNLAIAVLTVLVVVLLTILAADRAPALIEMLEQPPEGQPVEVVDVVLDRTELRTLDIFFDRPLGEDLVGDVLDPDPATVRPAVGGRWSWQATNVLRFEPTNEFEMAMDYQIALVADRLEREDFYLRGETEFSLRTDQFLVERVDTRQEPRLTGENEVVIVGNIRFNYAVEPEELIGELRLIDPQRGRGDPVPLGLETHWASTVISFRSEPVRKERAARELELLVGGALTPARGNVPLGEDHVELIALGSSEVLEVWQVVPVPSEEESSLRIQLSSPVEAAAAADYVTVEPAVEYRISGAGNELVLAGGFEPGTVYELTIADGLRAADEARLDGTYNTRVRIPDIEPSLSFVGEGMFVSAAGARRLALESVNVERVDLYVERVYRNNLHYLFQSYAGQVWSDEAYYRTGVAHSLGDLVAEESLDLGGERNRRQVTALELDRYLEGVDPGLYRIAVARPDTYRTLQRWVLITDMGMVAKEGDDELLVWVASFADLEPVRAARLTLLSDQNQVLATGQTDARGLWHPSGLAAVMGDSRPWLVIAERGGDFSFLLLDRMRVDTAGLEVGGAATSTEGYDAFLYGERDIYRPGETVEGVAVVRDRSLETPPPMPLVLRHRDPQGLETSSERLEMTGRGLASFDLDVPDYALTGNHSLELLAGDQVIGRYRFQVEEFVPDRIRVAVQAGDETLGPGDTLEFEVESAYLFGPPAGGLAVESRVRLEGAEFAPSDYGEFSFRNGEREFTRSEIFEASESLNEEGRRSFSVELPTGLRVASSLRAIITARVQEQGGRGVVAQHTRAVHPYPYYVGLRRDSDTYADPGTPETFEFVSVGLDGSRVDSGRLSAELYKDEWNTVLRRAASGNFRYVTTRTPRLIDSRVIEAGSTGGQFRFTAPEFGSYRVVITDPDTGASSQVSFYASGYGYSPWAIENPARVQLDLDKEEYSPGETVAVQVRSPFAGKVLLTVERDRVYETRVFDLEGNTATINLTAPGSYRPNVYVTATVVRSASDLDPDRGAIGRAYGAVPLYVDRASNRMQVGIEAPEEIRPGTTLGIQVSAAPRANVTVAAVDEGILQLIAQATPDPFAYFYRKLSLGVSSADSFALLLPEIPVETDAAVGGGVGAEGMAQYVRTEGIRRVQPVAFWSGVVQADGNGEARVQFEVPEFQGALRIMAVGHSGRSFGSSDLTTRVRDPLVVMPTFPRFLSFAERVQVPVTVRNDTGRDGRFEVTISVSGAASAQGETTLSADVADGAEETIYFQLGSANEPGDVRIDVAAAGNGEVTRSGVDLTVKPDLPVTTAETIGDIGSASTTLPLANAADYRPGTLRRRLRLSRLPLVQFSGQLRYIVSYPYGCLEQVTSRAFPLIYLGDLAREIDPELFAEIEPAGIVQESIRRVATLQHFTGGFTLWPRAEEVAPWPSIYTAHFLVEARRGGFLVPDYLYDGAMTFLGNEARARSSYAGDELERVVYSLYVLARAGQADIGTMDFVRENHEPSLRSLTRTLLAAAYASAGRAEAAEVLLRRLEQVEQVRRQTGGNFSSTIRNRAMVLLALLDVAPDDDRIPRLAQRLARDAETPYYWNTQESSLALLALGQLFRRQAERAPYAGTVWVGDRELGRFDSETTIFEIEGAEPIRIEMDPGYEAGAAFYSLQVRGVPTDDAFQPVAAGLELTSTLLTRDGQPLDPLSVEQGDLVVVRTQVRSTAGRLENVALQVLLPAGFEIENPRLSTSETLPWINDATLQPDFFDFRDDQALIFFGLPDTRSRTAYVLIRAVSPGDFRLPPVQVEAMYEPEIRATTDRGTIEVTVRR
jgi:uncharacterized protein YfaS (alpha-2-macroglobulin family)